MAHDDRPAPILRLPPQLRLRIYTASGILNGDASPPQHRMQIPYRVYSSTSCSGRPTNSRFINLNSRHTRKGRYEKNAAGVGTTHALLLTCRAIYEDVSAVVYSTNDFFVDYHEGNGVKALWALRPSSIQALRQLTLHLNATTCGLSPCERIVYGPWLNKLWRDDIREWVRGPTKAPFQKFRLSDQEAIYEWYRVWRDHIRPNLVTPGVLEFNLTCDVDTEATARLVVEPLLEDPVPCIAKCRIRLGRNRDPNIQALARRAVESIVARDRLLPLEYHRAKDTAFRFLDLPPEIRQSVLGYTDLVTRWKEVEWNPRNRMYYSRQKDLNSRDEREVPDALFGEANVTKNQACWRPEHLSSWFCFKQSIRHGCFCTSYHAAHSNTIDCKCWAPPTPLFLVCQVMRQDALQAFFSQNKFVIAPESVGLSRIGIVDRSHERLAASIFLTQVVPEAGLQHLRFLDIYFPAFGNREEVVYCPRNSPEQLDWINTLDYVKDKLSLSKLTVRATFGIHPEDNPCCWYPFRANMTQKQREDAKACYVTTIAPMRALRGMEKFFVHLPEPQASCYWEGEMYDTKLEREVEKMVMGKEYEPVEGDEPGESILSEKDNSMLMSA